MQLFPKQLNAANEIHSAWDNGANNVLLVYPCGGGKTVIFSNIITNHGAPTCAIAHRQELVSQISIALARNKVRHKIIGPKKVIKMVVNYHMIELGKSFYDPNSSHAVAGVDTLVRRNGSGRDNDYYYQIIGSKILEYGPRINGKWQRSKYVNEIPPNSLKGLKPPIDKDESIDAWSKSVSLWVQDEAHHVLKSNKWGTAATMFPNAKGLGVTATPERADGRGLGRFSDGVMDQMITGPTARELINTGYLTDYRIFNPPTDFNREGIPISQATGDFTQDGVNKAVKNSHVIGDIVKHYLKFAKGKLGITFVPGVDIAIETAERFNAAGIPAAVIHANTPDTDRIKLLRQFKNRELLELVNVDLFGEGFDLPALEVVQMARPTKSYALYHQQFMRALRLMISRILSAAWHTYTDAQRLQFIAESVKPYAMIIDHVNNIDTSRGGHGLPDAPRIWTLDRQEKRSKKKQSDIIPTRTCIECSNLYERIYKVCPRCGTQPIPGLRSGPEFVDGDLTELNAETLAAMRGEVERVDMKIEDYKKELENKYVPYIGQLAHMKRFKETQEMQEALRASMAWWGGYQRSMGRSDDESYRRFYFAFGVDVLSAKALKKRDAITLANKINVKLGELSSAVSSA